MSGAYELYEAGKQVFEVLDWIREDAMEEQERREAAKYGRPLRAAERQAIRTAKLDAQRRRNGGGRR